MPPPEYWSSYNSMLVIMAASFFTHGVYAPYKDWRVVWDLRRHNSQLIEENEGLKEQLKSKEESLSSSPGHERS